MPYRLAIALSDDKRHYNRSVLKKQEVFLFFYVVLLFQRGCRQKALRLCRIPEPSSLIFPCMRRVPASRPPFHSIRLTRKKASTPTAHPNTTGRMPNRKPPPLSTCQKQNPTVPRRQRGNAGMSGGPGHNQPQAVGGKGSRAPYAEGEGVSWLQ